jgi:CHRD domain
MLLSITLTSTEISAKKIATLSGDQVVPPVNTKATGHATFKHPDSTTMDYKVNITGISHPTGVGVHLGKMGSNGDLIVDLMKQAKSQPTDGAMIVTGSFTAQELVGPMKGKTILELVDSMKSGDTYISVDTEEHPTGEIRGQLELAHPPSSNKVNTSSIENQTKS